MIFGLYKHYKGGWYLALKKVSRDEKVLYFSFKERKLNVLKASEFFDVVPDVTKPGWNEFRFLKFTLFREACYCRELGAYEPCPRHGYPQYTNHLKLPRFDGNEHERKYL